MSCRMLILKYLSLMLLSSKNKLTFLLLSLYYVTATQQAGMWWKFQAHRVQDGRTIHALLNQNFKQLGNCSVIWTNTKGSSDSKGKKWSLWVLLHIMVKSKLIICRNNSLIHLIWESAVTLGFFKSSKVLNPRFSKCPTIYLLKSNTFNHWKYLEKT